MLRPRIIPCLLVRQNGLVKTVNFNPSKYVGDPINAVKIFNEKEVDELIVLDIDASVENRPPDFRMIENLAKECRMPFCYGGGVKTVDQAVKIVKLGAEKVAFSSAVIDNPTIIQEVGERIGNQSIVVVLDYKRTGVLGNRLELFTHNGNRSTGIELYEFVRTLNNLNVGELLLNSIERDGTMKGYDMKVAEKVRELFDGPLTILGGAGKLQDIKDIVEKFKVIGASAGSLFVFKGKYKAVLINYPSVEELNSESNLKKE